MTVLENITFAPIELGKENKEEAEKHALELEKLAYLTKLPLNLTVCLVVKSNVSRYRTAWP